MGSVGNKISAKPMAGGTELSNQPSDDEKNLEGYTTFTGNTENTVKWFKNPKLSNMEAWEGGLTQDQKNAISYYTGSGYDGLNKELYTKPWDDMTPYYKEKAANLYNAINNFELHKGIKTVRQCDFQIFGSKKAMTADQVKDYLTNQTIDGHIQINGFMSTTTKPNGTFADSHGVWIDLQTPPNKGGGAYVSHQGNNSGEGEYLYNSNAILRFDPNSVKMGSDGYVHVSAQWVGQAQDQTFKTKSKAKKK